MVAPTSFSFLRKACMCTSKKRSEQSSGCAQKNIRGSKYKIEKIVILDCKLVFDEYLKMVSLKISKTLGLLRKMQNLLPRSALITIYKDLADLILIMEIFFMIKFPICPFTINWNLFSIMPAWS